VASGAGALADPELLALCLGNGRRGADTLALAPCAEGRGDPQTGQSLLSRSRRAAAAPARAARSAAGS
jgi:hypothetical protein